MIRARIASFGYAFEGLAVMIRTQQGADAVDSLLSSGSMVAESITVTDMIGYNKHLVIGPDHDRHLWMAFYQILFHRRLQYLKALLRGFARQRIVGIRSTLQARFSKRYYY